MASSAQPAGGSEEGDVVGMHKGRVSRQVEGAAMVAIVTHKAVVVGSVPSAANGQREPGVEVMYCGRVPVRAEGTIRDGDVLYSSGRGDGLAVSSMELRMDIACIKPGETGKKPARRIVGVAIGTSGTGDDRRAPGRRGCHARLSCRGAAAGTRAERVPAVCEDRRDGHDRHRRPVLRSSGPPHHGEQSGLPEVTPVDGLIEYSNGLHRLHGRSAAGKTSPTTPPA